MSDEFDINQFDDFLAALTARLDFELYGDGGETVGAESLQTIKRFAASQPEVAQCVFNSTNDLYNGTGNL